MLTYPRNFSLIPLLVIFDAFNCTVIKAQSYPCDAINVIDRNQWRAKPPIKPFSPIDPVDHVFIHHSASRNCSNIDNCSKEVRRIQRWHQENRNFIDIGYNWIVGGDGNVYEGRNWDREGAHTRSFNRNSTSICLLGNYMKLLPSKQMLDVTKKLIECGLEIGKIRDDYHLHGHRDAGTTSTASPGDKLYNEIQHWSRYQKGPVYPHREQKQFSQKYLMYSSIASLCVVLLICPIIYKLYSRNNRIDPTASDFISTH